MCVCVCVCVLEIPRRLSTNFIKWQEITCNIKQSAISLSAALLLLIGQTTLFHLFQALTPLQYINYKVNNL